MSAKKTLSAEQRRALLATPAGWLACGFGSGLAPVAQGTFGSLAALLPWLLLRELSLPLYVVVLLVGFGVGVWACNLAGRALGVDDHRTLVWDEFIGQWVALLPLLRSATGQHLRAAFTSLRGPWLVLLPALPLALATMLLQPHFPDTALRSWARRSAP